MPNPRRIIPLQLADALGVEPASKVQARATGGRFTRWRWTMVWLTQLVFYGGPWLNWNGRQAVRFDLENRRFYLFSEVLLPQDLIYLTGLLVVCALLLFVATALAGRVWCGFSCPQTVYTELFQWIELRLEGDRRARQALDAAPWNRQKLARRGGRYLAWGLLSLWTGLSFVGWFSPMRMLVAALPSALGPWDTFWTLFYAGFTALNAGVLREKVCQHMCPYGRFQGSMLDRHTLVVAYDTHRGEPRGARPRGSPAAAVGTGDCVDCTLCVQVCPVGIDIRQGLQAACISCGVCIDACDRVMDKLRAPRGLIRFSTRQALADGAAPVTLRQHLTRPRPLVYLGLMTGIGLAMGWGLMHRPTLRLDVLRDRGVLARSVEDGALENVYRLRVSNAQERSRQVQLQVIGPEGLRLVSSETWELPPNQEVTVHATVRLPAPRAEAEAGQVLPMAFRLQETSATAPEEVSSASTFLVPRSP